jgi:hypothetical protein
MECSLSTSTFSPHHGDGQGSEALFGALYWGRSVWHLPSADMT